MNLAALLHIEKSSYAYAYSDRKLHFRLRTAKDDVRNACIVLAKKHEWEKKRRYPMRKVATDRLFDYYQFEYETDDPRLGYYFEVSDDRETLVYCESGVFETFDDANCYFHYFQFPYISPIDVDTVPGWMKSAVFYQIFVERFSNGDPSNDPQNLSRWNEPPTPTSFYGGDLQGVIDKLDYLAELGVTGLYLNPIFESPSNHKYDTADYRQVDGAFGSKETLCRLVELAHRNGMRVLLDGVFNHCGYRFAPFQDVLQNGEDSFYKDWFYLEGFPVTSDPCNYKTFSADYRMPKLNTANPALRRYILDTVSYWTRETGIDGWRLDVSDEVDHFFWRAFRETVKAINPEAVILGENWHNAYPWLMGDQFDSVMNYPVTKSCIQFFAQGQTDALTFSEDLSTYLMWNYEQVDYAMLNLLDSHDTMRFLTCCGGDKRRLRLAVLFLFSYVGAPCIYYGSEIGMEGKGDPDCRRTFDWDEAHWDHSLRAFYKRCIALRRAHPALQSGGVRLSAQNGVFLLEREGSGERLLTLLNNTDSTRTVQLPAAARGLLEQTGANGVTELPGRRAATLSPYSGGVLVLAPEHSECRTRKPEFAENRVAAL